MRASALYAGSVFHHRLRPRPHRLRHSLFQVLFDLDELDALDRSLVLFARDRFNLFSFHAADHGDGGGDLGRWARAQLAEVGVDASGPVRLLCIPRILGHAFNPLSVYFCHDRQGRAVGLIYQVNNTFGERHSYVIPVAEPHAGVVRQRCEKRFYVSPFMDMSMTYSFVVKLPADAVSVRVDGADAQGPIIATAFSGHRRDLTDRALLRAFFAFPLLSLKVVAAIGWGALRLWLKGLRTYERPAPPRRSTTVLDAGERK
ncbi:DUF1365 domain-containing protein [Caulobacter sp. 17J80-11]|nr:DUF1365 domain-containing protein [Caulobacter sp. 17J80-11]